MPLNRKYPSLELDVSADHRPRIRLLLREGIIAGAALDGERLTEMASALASKDAAALAALSQTLQPEARAGLQPYAPAPA